MVVHRTEKNVVITLKEIFDVVIVGKLLWDMQALLGNVYKNYGSAIHIKYFPNGVSSNIYRICNLNRKY